MSCILLQMLVIPHKMTAGPFKMMAAPHIIEEPPRAPGDPSLPLYLKKHLIE